MDKQKSVLRAPGRSAARESERATIDQQLPLAGEGVNDRKLIQEKKRKEIVRKNGEWKDKMRVGAVERKNERKKERKEEYKKENKPRER